MYKIRVIFTDGVEGLYRVQGTDPYYARDRWREYCDDHLAYEDCDVVQLLRDGEVVCQKKQDYSQRGK